MNEVWSSHQRELDAVEAYIRKEVDSEVPLINHVIHHIMHSGGKRIRPLLVVLSANLCAYTGRDHVALAGVVEFIHTATLLHDDVIDGAKIRRGFPAARVLWGNRESVLAGDYLYTLAMCQAVRMENLEVNDLLSTACRRMTEGETLQLVHDHDLHLTEENYLRIIEYKTAALISAGCQMGGVISGATHEQKTALRNFGTNLGIAFQVADDTLDYIADKNRLGKSLGKDLKEGKITLPLLHLLRHCNPEERTRIEKIALSGKASKEDLSAAIALMQKYHSTDYALGRASDYVNRAKGGLSSFEDSPARQALFAVADYVVGRDC